MGTVANLIEEARYDLADYEEGLDFDDRLLHIYLNRMIRIMDSQLAALDSDLVHATEIDIDTVADQNYVDLTYMNNQQWDSVKEVWIGTDRKQQIGVPLLYYKRKFRSGSAEPQYWALEGRRLLFECDADSAHTDVVIHYHKKHRPRLESWSDTFTADATNDLIVPTTGSHTFVTGDGPFTLTTTAADLPSGLAVSTNYWAILDPDTPTKFKLASSLANALDGTAITISDAGTGTHTITLGSDVMPWNGVFDDFIKEMLVMHAYSKRGEPNQSAMLNMSLFKKRAMEETIRRGFVPKYYSIDY